MKNLCLSILLLGVAILTTACPKTTPIKPQVLDKVANYQIAQLDNNIANYECAAYGSTVIVNGTSVTTAACPASNVIDLNKARQIRNATIHSLIRVTDYNYFQFENDLYVRRATGSFLADATDISANLAATITNITRAKTIINASLIAFRGGRKSAGIHYFQEQTADVLITKMQTARNRVLADILTQLRNNDVSVYPLEAALGDVIRYFYAGTLPRALQELKVDAGIDALKAQDEVRKVSGLKERGLVTQEIRDTSVIAKDNLNAIAAALSTDKERALKKLNDILIEIEKDASLKNGLSVTSAETDGAKIIKALINLRRDKADAADGEEALRKINNIIARFGKLSE